MTRPTRSGIATYLSAESTKSAARPGTAKRASQTSTIRAADERSGIRALVEIVARDYTCGDPADKLAVCFKQGARGMTRPFEGIRIIDITHVLAGPFAAYQLAVLGAD